MQRVLSGVQPTGNLHLGNYLGAIKNWVALQSDYECLYCIVDLHAITVAYNAKELLASTRKTAAAYIACGVDPKKSSIFVQSSISAHSELAWYLGTMTPLGWLNRMTQFKEKSGKNKDNSSLGLYGYPVLMAADILLYKADLIPVGDDQKQHLELTRDIAGMFNRTHDIEYFKLPEPLIAGKATRVMSLRDGTKKMSKSEESDNSRINITDDADTIARKIRKAKSDSEIGLSYDVEARPEASNLINIYCALNDCSVNQVIDKYANSGFADFKKDLADLAVEKISPISSKIKELEDDTEYLDSVLRIGSEKAADIASDNLKEIKQIMGFLSV